MFDNDLWPIQCRSSTFDLRFHLYPHFNYVCEKRRLCGKTARVRMLVAALSISISCDIGPFGYSVNAQSKHMHGQIFLK